MRARQQTQAYSNGPPAVDARRAMLVGALLDLDGEAPSVISSHLATGGNSHENWVFRVRRKGRESCLVLRCDPDDWIRPEEMEREVAGLTIAEAINVPAPRLVASHHTRRADRPYTIVNFVEGESIPRRIHSAPNLAGARATLAETCGAILGKLASTPLDLARGLQLRDPIETLRGWYSRAEAPSPVLSGAVQWLTGSAPAAGAPSVVHGDFRLGNLIVGEDGVRAVLDWETVHLGDPYEDLAWLCQRAWRYGGAGPVAGLAELDELFAAYAGVSGAQVDVERFRWWLVWGASLWALVCREQATVRRAGAGDDMECAAVARLVCLQEANVLAELEHWVG
ncbi:phosphotransferase family protein [Phenylobacterium sp.]|jgi:aminoglycoside phosphotransferase (APT) family kinase protein|uniref:phosphotransferase family protein n=1 Tax=Phenylobacterium sp. TaxID=1871053 RepID=UPI002F421B8B